jgi:hypothetical protein
MSFTTQIGGAGPYPANIRSTTGVAAPSVGAGQFTLQDILAVQTYNGTQQAGLWRRSTFGWDLFTPQPTWRTNALAQAVWGHGTGAIVVHDSISTNRFMHFDGSSWSNVDGFRTGAWVCEAIGGNSPDELWAAGEGYVGYYNGTSWTEVLGYLAELDPVRCIWVAASGQVWVVGGTAGNEGVYVYAGGSWTNVYSQIEAVDSDIGVPMAVCGIRTGSDVWVAFDLCANPSVSGRIARWDGDSWAMLPVTAEGLQAMWGLSTASDKLWAAGDDSSGTSPVIICYNGASWDDKITGYQVARKMMGFIAGSEDGVYLVTGTPSSTNGHIYRRWYRTGIDDEHEWLDEQDPPHQWCDIAVREEAPTVSIDTVDPDPITTAGGHLITLTGTFPVDEALEVFLGPTGDETDDPCYSGESGSGYSPSSSDGTTLEIVSPPMSKGDRKITVRYDGDNYTADIEVVEYPYADVVFEVRHNWPKDFSTGPRDITSEPEQ